MRIRHEKNPKLSDAVRQAVDAQPFLKMPMEMGLVNYSALARKIKPHLEKRLDSALSVEAIAMALHRNVEPSPLKVREQPKDVLDVIAGCKIHLLPDMVTLHYPYNRKLQERLHQVKTTIEQQGGNLYVIERENEISITTQKKFQSQVNKIAEKVEPLDKYHDVALLSIQYPSKGLKQPGVLNYLVQCLTSANINLLGVFNSYSKISFGIAENDAPTAYERLSSAIATAKTLE